MEKFFKQKNKKNSGFTLVETLVAISIFTVSVLALMSVLSSGISDITYARKKILATYLAQEGIEYIRNVRDTYVLYSVSGQNGWNAFNAKMTGAFCNQANGCYFDDQDLNYSDQSMPITDIFMTACASACPPLLYNSSNGKYNYASGVTSDFVRKIRINVTNSNEIKVFSTVFWTQGSGVFQLTFSETLFNWVE